MDDLLDSDRAGEGFGLSRNSDKRVKSPKGAITNQPAPMTPFEELQHQRDLAEKQKAAENAEDEEEEYDDDIEFEEDKTPNFCFNCCKTIACLPINLFIQSTRCCCRVKHVAGFEQAIIYRNGKKREISPSGYFLVLPCFDTFNKVDMRTVVFEIPEQYLCTKDAINICIDGLVYYRVSNADDLIQSAADPATSAKKLTQVALRRSVMKRTVDQIFDSEEREEIEEEMQDFLNKHAEKWGLEIERVYIKDLLLPENIQQSIEEEMQDFLNKRAEKWGLEIE